MSITELIDKRIELKRIIDNAEQQLKKIDAEIKEEHEIGEVLLGSEGYGYQITPMTQTSYPIEALEAIPQRLRVHFMKVSKTKLDKLKESGHLAELTYRKINRYAKTDTVPVIRDFIPDEAKPKMEVKA